MNKEKMCPNHPGLRLALLGARNYGRDEWMCPAGDYRWLEYPEPRADEAVLDAICEVQTALTGAMQAVVHNSPEYLQVEIDRLTAHLKALLDAAHTWVDDVRPLPDVAR